MTEDTTELQRCIARAALRALDGHHFALAGSGAIREHGFIRRMSRDVDLFSDDQSSFGAAVDARIARMTAEGFVVEQVRRYESFAQVRVTTATGEAVEVDLAVDWRAAAPVMLQVGPVLAIEDAVASKVGAIYTRLEARDFIDLDAIRRSGRFMDDELLEMAAGRDDGFDSVVHAQQLRMVERIRDGRFEDYGTTGAALDALRARTLAWADAIDATGRGAGAPVDLRH